MNNYFISLSQIMTVIYLVNVLTNYLSGMSRVWADDKEWSMIINDENDGWNKSYCTVSK